MNENYTDYRRCGAHSRVRTTTVEDGHLPEYRGRRLGTIDTDNINQMAAAGTDVEAESGTVAGYVPSLRVNVLGKGIFADSSVVIESVSGSIFIEEAGVRNQEQNISEALRALFLPGNPFNVEGE